ncbi:MAG: glycosyltransferase family 4 protein [Halanaerobiaceae bacterium]
MKILMLSWEYTPLSQGGLARHVQDLSETLVAEGHSVHIITRGDENIPSREKINGVDIIRTEPPVIDALNFVDFIHHLNFQLLERAIQLKEEEDFDVIHGHDWLVFWATRILKHSYRLPVVHTIHATEYGRNQGIYNDMQRYINDIEWYCGYEAWKVIVCSNYMKNEVRGLFQVPGDKIRVIENGVNPANYRSDYTEDFRSRYASPAEKIVFYVGRIVREKGIQILLQAVPEILSEEPATKFIISGRGPFLEDLKHQARYLGIEDRIYFTGFASNEVRNKLYRAADVVVIPSIYEPFGIVALEGMTTGTPVVASDVGGMSEFLEYGHNAFTVEPGDPSGLAGEILHVFRRPEEASSMAERARKMVEEKFSWDNIAPRTVKVYREVRQEYKDSSWNINKDKAREREQVLT